MRVLSAASEPSATAAGAAAGAGRAVAAAGGGDGASAAPHMYAMFHTILRHITLIFLPLFHTSA